MGVVLKLILLILGVVFVFSVIRLLVNRKINERNSILWLGGSLVILVLSASPDLLDTIAAVAGVDYPPTLLFVLSILVILFILLYQSIQISILQEKSKELAQHLAIAKASMDCQQPQSVLTDDEKEGILDDGHAVRQNQGA